MKILVSWLRDFVDVAASPEEIARTMSVRGFAVESIEPVRADLAERLTNHSSPADASAGASAKRDLSAVASAKADAVLDFEVTANRPDCMSVMGMAREVATAYGLPMRYRAVEGEGSAAASTRGKQSAQSKFLLISLKAVERAADVSVVIENPELCPRYAGAVANVTVGSSPVWMQARLEAAGVRPISSIVDVTNYVLLEMGQPMHAFDLSKLVGAQIRVRTAREGESLKTLDGQTRELTPDMLVIADRERAVAIAGVMGGADSEVTRETRAIVLESAYFNPLSVRRTSRKLGLKTEASIRFERGGDPHLPVVAMERACALLEIIGAGAARGMVVDRYPARIDPATIRLRRAKIKGLLGIAVPDADVKRILDSLGFVLRDASDGWAVTVPTRRVDAVREVDLIEEVARHYGFDRLPSAFPALTSPPPPIDPRIRTARHLRTIMTAEGFSEAMTFGFVGRDAAAPFAAEADLVPIANPLSENFAVLRPSALHGILGAVAHNRRREQRDVRLFEIGARFTRARGENRSLACAWIGAASGDHWSGGERDVDFFDMKGIVERLADALRLDARTESHDEQWLVQGRSAALMVDETRIGVLGQIAPALAEAHGLSPGDAVYVAEIDLDTADRLSPREDVHVEELPRYPSVTRDISILIDESIAAAAIRATISSTAPATLVQVREFDRYQGKGVPEGKVSLSLRLTFRSSDRTLTDAEAQSAMEAILAALQGHHAAVQR